MNSSQPDAFYLAGFAQWKAIIHLLLGCQDGPLKTHLHFFIRFLQCLHSQLQHSLLQVRVTLDNILSVLTCGMH